MWIDPLLLPAPARWLTEFCRRPPAAVHTATAMAAAQLSEALASNQLVTFRWYAQQYGVPAEEAKATLQEYVHA